NALILLDALTDETVADESFERWEGREDWEDEPTSFFEALGPVWAEALLSTELTTQERIAWADKLEAWQDTPAQYGYDAVFEVAIEAAEQGWDDPALQRVLQGQSTEPISRPRAVSVWGGSQGDLTALRLAILDRQGRHDAYLHLAMAERRTASYATMLVRLHRVQEAVDYGLVHLVTPDDALNLAQALWDRGEWQPARQIAEHGMSLPGRKGALAPWLRDAAAAMGDTVQALGAAVVMFKEAPSLPVYLQVQELDPVGWPARRADLLEHLRQLPRSYHPVGAVEIFLHEGLIDDAIAAVDHGATHTLVEQVVEAAIATHPDWVIKTARGQAEPFMDGGKAQYYGAAVRWLARARDAYRGAGREAEWQAYYQELMALHGRKYKLVPMLQTLR
ncbi:MAG: SWIM zinc finger domain-containing protein, partial [Chloroflexota bacterium]|nr:SWIM zinc finger domain-containing protein [Chloroflexota bacterium]